MRLNNFDLNLLVALHALLEERSVTRAAERLNMTQPAMSAALRRLRESFNDELLAVSGKRMVPTSHAQNLAPMVEQMIVGAQSLISSSTRFDASTSRRVFRLYASDYIVTILLQPMLIEMAKIAPDVRIEVLPFRSDMWAELDRGTIDCIIYPEQFQLRDHPQELLFEETHVLLGWSENSIFEAAITQEIYDSASHVAVKLNASGSFAEEHIRSKGDTRRIEVTVSSFTMVPWLLPGTNRIALVHSRLAKLFTKMLPLAMAKPPFEVPIMRETIQFHRTRTVDGGLMWLKDNLMKYSAGS
ncbi:MAG: LysR family transcriptional regulator [Novosphingobium sp.]|nr:LysR family transcriptional regulator [Novosphingobium sp.]